MNRKGGVDYTDNASNKRAKEADLVTLPKEVEGTNCANCRFVTVLDAKAGTGYCNHPKVKLNVTKRMCCAFWDNKDASRSWEKK